MRPGGANPALEASRMSEEEATEEGQEPTEAEFDPARARAALEKKNREAASLRARLKELEPLATKAREADEAAKTELQKATEARAAVERERDEARTELLRMRVATAEGLPPDLAARLRGTTEDELKADAKELLKLVKPVAQTPARPVADLKPGALPAGDRQPSNSADIDRWIRSQAGVTPS